jgi:arginyl-tRNA synthetase
LKEYINEILSGAIKKLGVEDKDIEITTPREEKFGDFTTNLPLTLAKELKSSPRKIAEDIIANLEYDKRIEKVEIAGAGFINFFVGNEIYKDILPQILTVKGNYGRSDEYKGKRANLEWVSANPTGPLHAGHGRQVSLGSAIATLLEWVGYDVTREYYYNDAGTQMDNLGKSVHARYMQIMDKDFPFPEDGYHGESINKIAQKIYDDKGDSLKNSGDLAVFKKAGEEYNFNTIKEILARLGIKHDVFYNETSLYNDGKIEELLEAFKEKGQSYESEGAVWLKMDESEGFEKDKVIVKSTGEPTYRLPDMTYHIDKIKRGYDLIIDIFGADHGDTYKEVLYGVRKAGFDTSNIKVIIHQMVTFKKGAESVKMSKRSGDAYLLNELLDDVGVDATQFFFVMRGANTHLDFDVELAKEQSDKNPVYYLQYAHARICGILRNADDNLPEYKNVKANEINLNLISTPEEIKLLKTLSQFPEVVSSSAETFEPHKIITYLNEVAGNFHSFYHHDRVINLDEKELSLVRLQIILAVQQVLKNGFKIIGITAPERM